ncbi:MAG: hypothetical protein FD153_1755 [Rhodospirillaceae bacterium]|nr:MAG: hypothetical protein FD153_1755 [Rhodospirillaceae bacterium]
MGIYHRPDCSVLVPQRFSLSDGKTPSLLGRGRVWGWSLLMRLGINFILRIAVDPLMALSHSGMKGHVFVQVAL